MLCGGQDLEADRTSVASAGKGLWVELQTSRFSLCREAEGTGRPTSHFPDVLSSHVLYICVLESCFQLKKKKVPEERQPEEGPPPTLRPRKRNERGTRLSPDRSLSYCFQLSGFYMVMTWLGLRSSPGICLTSV